MLFGNFTCEAHIFEMQGKIFMHDNPARKLITPEHAD